MEGHVSTVADSFASGIRRKLAVAVLLAAMLALSVGHLYAIGGLTTLYLGLPVWIWIQLAVLAVLLVLARVTVGLITPDGEGGR